MSEKGEIVIYQTEDGLTKINVSMHDDTIWLTLDQPDGGAFRMRQVYDLKAYKKCL